MTSFSSGKYALMVSDRSGQTFPWREMVREWNGAWVHFSEYEPKQPQLQPRPTSADPQALSHARHQEQHCLLQHHWIQFHFQLTVPLL